GWFLWQKFMRLGGGQDVLDVGRHQLAVTIRPYLRRDTLVTGPLLATGNLAVDVADIPVDPSLVPVQAIAADSGWEVSDAAFDRRRIEALNKKIAQGRFRDINGIVVIKDGALLLEEYFNGATRENLHNPRSVGKTIASSVLGIAIEEGHISDAGKRLGEFYDLRSFDNYHPKKDSVTLRSLLTMSSGFVGDDNDFENPGNEENMYPTKDWVRFALDLPMEKDRGVGEYFSYFTAGVVVLGDVIHRAVPGGLVDYADEKLFAPLGITDYRWQYTPQKVGNTAGGIQLRAVDFAKYGQLYQNRGNWNGIQILPEAWVKESLSPQIALPRGDGDYGYLFWQKTYEVGGKAYEVAYCSGNGGNKIFVFRDIPLVVVITSSAYGAPDAHPNADKIMTDYILPAVLD
ncbi:MAG: serine hydrolase, partial [Bacteroidota bacterium]